MAQSRAKQSPEERRLAALLSFVHAPERFCRARGITFSPALEEARYWVVRELEYRARRPPADRLLTGLSGRRVRTLRSLVSRGEYELLDGELVETTRVQIAGIKVTAASVSPDLQRIHNWLAKTGRLPVRDVKHYFAPSTGQTLEVEWYGPTTAPELAGLGQALRRTGDPVRITRMACSSVFPHVRGLLRRIQPVPDGAGGAPKQVLRQLALSATWPWGICECCGVRVTIRRGHIKDCYPCRRRFPDKQRSELRRVLAVLPAAAGSGLTSDEIRGLLRAPQPSTKRLGRLLLALRELGRVECSRKRGEDDLERWHQITSLGAGRRPRAKRRQVDLTDRLGACGVPLLTEKEVEEREAAHTASEEPIPQFIPTTEEVRRRTEEILRRAAPSLRWKPSRILSKPRRRRGKVKRLLRYWF